MSEPPNDPLADAPGDPKAEEEIRKRQMVVVCRGCFAVLEAESATEETRRTGRCGNCRTRGKGAR